MQADSSLSVLESLNEILMRRRKLEQVLKYKKAQPGIMQAARGHLSSKGMGFNAWFDLLFRYEKIPDARIANMIAQIDNEVDYRLNKLFITISR